MPIANMIKYMVALLARTLFGYKIQNSSFVKYYCVNVSSYHCFTRSLCQVEHTLSVIILIWDHCMDLNMCSTMCLQLTVRFQDQFSCALIFIHFYLYFKPPVTMSKQYPEDDPDYCVWVPPSGKQLPLFTPDGCDIIQFCLYC